MNNIVQFMRHPSVLELQQYCDGRASEASIQSLEQHLGTCSACRHIANSFASIDAFLDLGSEEYRRHAAVRVGLQRCARSQTPAKRTRFNRWSAHLKSGEGARSSSWRGALIAVKVAPAETKSSPMSGVQISITRSVAADSGHRSAAQGVLRGRGVDVAGSDIEIRIEDLPESGSPSLVALVSEDGSQEPRVGDLEQLSPEVGVARFRGIPPGAYFIAIEP